MAVYSLKTFVHSFKNAINPVHKIPKRKNQSSCFITLDITFHITLDITRQMCLYNMQVTRGASTFVFQEKGENLLHGAAGMI